MSENIDAILRAVSLRECRDALLQMGFPDEKKQLCVLGYSATLHKHDERLTGMTGYSLRIDVNFDRSVLPETGDDREGSRAPY